MTGFGRHLLRRLWANEKKGRPDGGRRRGMTRPAAPIHYSFSRTPTESPADDPGAGPTSTDPIGTFFRSSVQIANWAVIGGWVIFTAAAMGLWLWLLMRKPRPAGSLQGS